MTCRLQTGFQTTAPQTQDILAGRYVISDDRDGMIAIWFSEPAQKALQTEGGNFEPISLQSPERFLRAINRDITLSPNDKDLIKQIHAAYMQKFRHVMNTAEQNAHDFRWADTAIIG